MFYNTDFLPQVLAILGAAAALTVLLSLLVAVVPLPRRRQRPHAPSAIGPMPGDHEALTPQPYH
jgi:hypothetical protein